ncbi:hypothetical protein SAMN05216390_10196 [Lachnospiraceae bacterium KH1T2]|jgi:hypothetical protein|nr:hypothetical protein SAMN05216390_10196 [Lachnospiraceae bacterium KH1T2]
MISGADRNNIIKQLAQSSGLDHLVKVELSEEGYYDSATGTWHSGGVTVRDNDVEKAAFYFRKQFETCRKSTEPSIREAAKRYLIAAEAIKHSIETGVFSMEMETE